MPAIMNNTNRSGQLAPLSNEHTDGLLFVERIRQGLAHHVEPETIRKYCFWYWKNHIKPHFRHEEDILLKYLPKDNLLVSRMCNEHEAIRELILSLDDEADRVTLNYLANLLQEHIYFEEDELFEQVESLLPQEQLKEINGRIEEHPICCEEEWSDEFWLGSIHSGTK